MATEITIGIVVPVYNVKKYLSICLDSIVSQTYRHWELVIIDDGSSDGSSAICDQYAEMDKRIKVFHVKNGGLVSAWKNGTKLLPDYIDYLVYIDPDDWISERYLEVLSERRRKNDADIVVTDICKINENKEKEYVTSNVKTGYYDKEQIENKIYPYFFSSSQFQKHLLSCSRCGKLIKRSLIMENYRYVDNAVTYEEDLNIMIPAYLDASGIEIIKEKDCLYYYRTNMESMTKSYNNRMKQSISLVYNSLELVLSEKTNGSLLNNQLSYEYLAACVQLFKNELMNPNHITGCIHEIELFLSNNNKLRHSIEVTRWKEYELKNRLIVGCLNNFRGINKYVVTPLLYMFRQIKQ